MAPENSLHEYYWYYPEWTYFQTNFTKVWNWLIPTLFCMFQCRKQYLLIHAVKLERLKVNKMYWVSWQNSLENQPNCCEDDKDDDDNNNKNNNNLKVQSIFTIQNNITRTKICKQRTATTLYTSEICFVCEYIILNTLYKGSNSHHHHHHRRHHCYHHNKIIIISEYSVHCSKNVWNMQ